MNSDNWFDQTVESDRAVVIKMESPLQSLVVGGGGGEVLVRNNELLEQFFQKTNG